MKKLLLSTAAAAGASVLATSAFALPIQSKDDAGTPILTVGMIAHFEAGFAENDVMPEGATRDGGFVNGARAGIYFDGEMTADNGLVYGAKLHFNTDNVNLGQFYNNDGQYNDNASAAVGREYIYLKGNWGSVELGNWPGPDVGLTLAPIGAYVTGAGGLDLHYKSYAYAPSGSVVLGVGPLWFNDMESKVTYYTPVVGGFQAGVSYTPVAGDDSVAGGPQSDIGKVTDRISYGVKWSGDMGGATVGLAAVGRTSDDVTTATGAGKHGDDIYEVSGRLNYAGMQFGLGYFDSGDSGAMMGDSQDYSGWTMNAAYTFGPVAVELQYAIAEKSTDSMGEDGMMTNATSEFDGWAISVGYALAPGLKWYGEVVGVEFDNEGDKMDNDALVALSGVILTF